MITTKGRGKDLTFVMPIRRFVVSERSERLKGGKYTLSWLPMVNGIALVWQKGRIKDKRQLLQILKLVIKSIEIDLSAEKRVRENKLDGDIRLVRAKSRKFLEKGLTPIPEELVE